MAQQVTRLLGVIAVHRRAVPQRVKGRQPQLAAPDLDRHYREHYPGAALDVIEIDGEPAGRLYVHRGTSDIRIMDIALAPAFRRRGIGTGLLRTLIAEAEESARKLSIHVEMNNPARTLYERLGFRAVAEHGVYLLMERAYAKTAW